MRLLQLYLEDYRVLRQLTLTLGEISRDEDTTYALSFLVGENGSGKSTVLKALVDVLRRLEQKIPIPTLFRLEYILGRGKERQHIQITNHRGDDGNLEIQVLVNGVSMTLGSSLLPHRVVIFTTGNEEDWKEQQSLSQIQVIGQEGIKTIEDLHLTSTLLALQELPGKPIRPQQEDTETSTVSSSHQDEMFLFIQAKQIPLLTLCGLLEDLARYEKAEEGLLWNVFREAKIRSFRGFSLKFRMNRGTTDDADRDFIEKQLKEIATRALRLGTDYLLVFDLTGQEHALAQNILQRATGESEVIPETARGLRLFERLAQLADAAGSNPPILREINLFFERFPERDPHTHEIINLSPILLFDWLSDGEQSFLGRMCLFSLLGDIEALILMDEPEVHFNDYWKRQIVYLIDKVLQGRTSHALITTHSSITLTDAPREDIVILDRGEIYTSNTFSPGIRTYAADPSDIIVSVFGAPQAAGAKSVNRVQEAFKIRDDASRKTELNRLLKIVGPGYWRYRIRRELLSMGE